MADVHTTRRMDEAEEKDHLMQLVGFMNGKEMFGVDILMVQEIIRGAPITAVPLIRQPSLKGSPTCEAIIPVIDLRRRPSYRPTGKIWQNWVLILDICRQSHRFCRGCCDRGSQDRAGIHRATPEIVVAGLENQYVRGFTILANACSSCSISIVFCWWRKSKRLKK